MGFNNENANRLIFDIETAPLPDAAEFLDLSEITAPANYKDPVKIAAYIEEEKSKALSRCGLDVDLARIVAVGWHLEGGESRALLAGDNEEEGELLTAFWAFAWDRHLIGFNCLGFDLPMLLRRSAYLRVPTPDIQIDKFRHPRVTDLMQMLSFNGAVRARSLAFYGKRFGVKAQDDTTGADIPGFVAAGEWEKVKAHVRADVQTTAALASRLIGFTVSEPVAA